MSILRNAWDLATILWDEATDWVYDLRHRNQKFQIADEYGVSTYYAPKEISRDRWQEMIRTKVGGETQHARDISIQHQACILYFWDLVEVDGLSAEEAFTKVQAEDVDIKKYVPEFLMPPQGMYPEKSDPTLELPKL